MVTIEFKDNVACKMLHEILSNYKGIQLDLEGLNAEIIVNQYELGEETKEENMDLINEFELLGLELILKWHIFLKEYDEDVVKVTIKYYDGETIIDAIVTIDHETRELEINVLNDNEEGAKTAVARAFILGLNALEYLDSKSVQEIKEKHKMTFADGKAVEENKVKYVYESVPVELLEE